MLRTLFTDIASVREPILAVIAQDIIMLLTSQQTACVVLRLSPRSSQNVALLSGSTFQWQRRCPCQLGKTNQ
jgi:hypothetical protein